ncbi:MAG: hypothetical protein U0350_17265 [Caldilineaceae bacterium]
MHVANHPQSWQVRCDWPEEFQFAGYLGQKVAALAPRYKNEWRRWWLLLVQDEPPFDPPAFKSVAPPLQSVCQRLWPQFHEEWEPEGGKKEQFIDKILKQLNAVDVSQIVNSISNAATSSFMLKIDFVVWPESYKQILADNYIILGAQYTNAAYLDQLRTLLQEQITKLV